MKISAIVYDLIPLIFHEHYYQAWPGQEFVARYRRGLERLRTYDRFFAISEATRRDLITHLGVEPHKITTIMGASDAPCWRPEPIEPTDSELRSLRSLGIDRPFIYSMGAMEHRKNLRGLLEAFALIPGEIRGDRRLVLTYAMQPHEVDQTREICARLGILDHLVITPRVDDETLATLYRRCDAFVFPSKYEGLGLPVLEAMHCGAAVVTGRNSSLVEVVGDAGLLVDVGDAKAMSSAISSLLKEPKVAAELKRRAPVQANQFRWSRVARAALDAIDSIPKSPLPKTRLRVDHPEPTRRPRPRIAFFSPLPPLVSGISDYSERLIGELKNDYAIDVFHDSGYEPNLKLRSLDFPVFDHRLFSRRDSILHYHAIVYQMGNSPLHKYIYDRLPIDRGIVTLHDLSLGGFRFWDAVSSGGGVEAFRRDLEDYDPRLASELGPNLEDWARAPGVVIERCADARAYLNQRIFRESLAVVMHSPWCVRQARAIHGDLTDKCEIVPYGATTLARTSEERGAIRDHYGIPRDAFVVGNFGLVHQTKMNVESALAFAPLARERPEALFLVVGPEYDNGETRETVRRLGLEDRARFLGSKPADEFVDLTAIADIGLNLRRPPTNGETSSSLVDLLRQGVATIISDIGTFSDFPSSAVRKIAPGPNFVEDLTSTLLELSRSETARRELGDSAMRYMSESHAWSIAARRYREIIDRCGRGGPSSVNFPKRAFQPTHS